MLPSSHPRRGHSLFLFISSQYRLAALFCFILPIDVIAHILQLVGQILLVHPPAWEAVGIEIALLPLQTGGIGVDILEMPPGCPLPCPGAHRP